MYNEVYRLMPARRFGYVFAKTPFIITCENFVKIFRQLLFQDSLDFSARVLPWDRRIVLSTVQDLGDNP